VVALQNTEGSDARQRMYGDAYNHQYMKIPNWLYLFTLNASLGWIGKPLADRADRAECEKRFLFIVSSIYYKKQEQTLNCIIFIYKKPNFYLNLVNKMFNKQFLLGMKRVQNFVGGSGLNPTKISFG